MSTCIPCVHRLLQETSTAVAENLRKQFSGLAGTLHTMLLQRNSLSWAVQQTLQQQVTCCLACPSRSAPVGCMALSNQQQQQIHADCRCMTSRQSASRSRQSSCGATAAASQWRRDLLVHPHSSRRAIHVAQEPHRHSKAGSL
jgi:hypothetical protein